MRMAYFMDAKLETSGAEKPQIEVRHRNKLSKHISVGGSVASQITHNAWALRAAGLGRLRRRFCALRARCTPPAAAAFSSPLRKNCPISLMISATIILIFNIFAGGPP